MLLVNSSPALTNSLPVLQRMSYDEYGGQYPDYPDYPDTFGWAGQLVAVPGFGFLPPRMEEVLEAEAQVGDSRIPFGHPEN